LLKRAIAVDWALGKDQYDQAMKDAVDAASTGTGTTTDDVTDKTEEESDL
jgi:hypothetical protein